MSVKVEIKNLSGGYLKGVNILQGVSLTIDHGETIGVIGMNGSGKSTLGKSIMNLLPYRKGTILFEGEDVTSLPTSMLSLKGIAMMQQGGTVFPTLSLYDNLQIAFHGKGKTDYVQQLKSIIPLLQQPERSMRHTMADKLSGGQRHQLALAMTLACHPKFVILDEPSAGLSPLAVEEMYEILGQVKECFGLSILLIEQNVMRAVEFCERCVMLGEGKIVEIFRDGNNVEIEKNYLTKMFN